jgi:hypothetical protein
MSNLLLQLLKALIASMAAMLSPDVVKKIVDSAFDKIEDTVAKSSNHWDDAVVLPMLTALRTALNVPDNDGQES